MSDKYDVNDLFREVTDVYKEVAKFKKELYKFFTSKHKNYDDYKWFMQTLKVISATVRQCCNKLNDLSTGGKE